MEFDNDRTDIQLREFINLWDEGIMGENWFHLLNDRELVRTWFLYVDRLRQRHSDPIRALEGEIYRRGIELPDKLGHA